MALVAAATFLETYHGIVAGADMVAHLAHSSAPVVFEDWATDPGSAVILAETTVGAAPIGYAVVTSPDLPVPLDTGDFELRRMYVLAPFHRAGVGAALMTAAVAAARARGAGRLLLGVHGGNDRAHRFYERQGFAKAGTRRFLVGGVRHDDLVYARTL